MAIHVAATKHLSPPCRMNGMSALLTEGAGSESQAKTNLKARADAQSPENAAPMALDTFYRHRGAAA